MTYIFALLFLVFGYVAQASEFEAKCDVPNLLADYVDLGVDLIWDYEPSDIDFAQASGTLFLVSDEGILTQMTVDGSVLFDWDLGGDLEGVTVANGVRDDKVYVAVEYPAQVLEFDYVLGKVTREFDLAAIVDGATSSTGIEALTFVPGTGLEGGYFWVGNQSNGKVHKIELPIVSSEFSESVKSIGSFIVKSGYTDLAALDYDATQGVVRAVFDANDLMVTLSRKGKVTKEEFLPMNDQEGITRDSSCQFYIAQDTDKKVWQYQE